MPTRPFSDTMHEIAVEDPDMLWDVVSGLLTYDEFRKEPESKPAAEKILRDYLQVPADEIALIINDPARIAERYGEPAPAQS